MAAEIRGLLLKAGDTTMRLINPYSCPYSVQLLPSCKEEEKKLLKVDSCCSKLSGHMQIVLKVDHLSFGRFVSDLLPLHLLLFLDIDIVVNHRPSNTVGFLHVFHNHQYFVAQWIRVTDVWWHNSGNSCCIMLCLSIN